jgi:hypothetical protein
VQARVQGSVAGSVPSPGRDHRSLVFSSRTVNRSPGRGVLYVRLGESGTPSLSCSADSSGSQPGSLAAAVRRYPEVADACTVTGEADALVHIRAAHVKHFERVMERIGAEPFVLRTRSVIVLSRLVERADSFAPSERA